MLFTTRRLLKIFTTFPGNSGPRYHIYIYIYVQGLHAYMCNTCSNAWKARMHKYSLTARIRMQCMHGCRCSARTHMHAMYACIHFHCKRSYVCNAFMHTHSLPRFINIQCMHAYIILGGVLRMQCMLAYTCNADTCK